MKRLNRMSRISAATLIVIVALAATGAWAALRTSDDPLSLQGPLIQGALIRGVTLPGARIKIGKRKIPVSAQGHFVFGLGRKAPARIRLTAVLPGGRTIVRKLTIARREYQIQRIDKLAKKKVTPPKESMDRIIAESKAIRVARKVRTKAAWYRESFIWPVGGVITGVYGSQRILNGKPRRPHYGIDIAAPKNAPIFAPASGVISFVQNDMYFTGNTLMIDHGAGVSTFYSHMSRLLVKKGQKVERGEAIGLIGATGRATGPHLHWALSLFRLRLDPALLVEPEPRKRYQKVTPQLPAP